MYLGVSIAIRDSSCSVSPSTVQIVDNCPDSEDEWRQAAARKNCAAYASNCSEPEKLVYHCVINSFVNQTLEVCAYWRITLFGSCTEYSLSGNIIQRSWYTNCTQFTKNPCPLAYKSNDSYKYPGCYELTKKTTTQPAATSTFSTTNTTHMNNEKQADGGSPKDFIFPVIIAVVLLLIVVVAGVCFILLWRKVKKRKKDPKISEEESKSLRVTVDTETNL